jgi:hypothetical protein
MFMTSTPQAGRNLTCRPSRVRGTFGLTWLQIRFRTFDPYGPRRPPLAPVAAPAIPLTGYRSERNTDDDHAARRLSYQAGRPW